MSTSFATPGSTWSVKALLQTSGIPLDVQRHLMRVYATLAACVLSAALGCGAALLLAPTPLYAAENASTFAMVSLVGSIGGSIWLVFEPVQHYTKRFAILMGVSTSIGLSLASIVDIALEIDPSVLITAFLMTTTVFMCFSASAMLAQRRSYLYLGGMLSSALSMLMWANLINLFWRSSAIDMANLYVGLAIFSGYVIFDTQMIIERALMGDKDSLKHALDLFLDFVSIFVRILAILLRNSEKNSRNDDDNKRSG